MDWTTIIVACGVLLIIYCFTALLQFVVAYWGHMLGINIETDMRRLMFDHLQKLSFRFYDKHKTGHLLSRISTDLWDIGEVAHHGPEDVFIAFMTLIAAFVLMMTVHMPMALMTFLVVPGMIWLGIHFNHRMTQAFRAMYGEIAEFNARVEDNIGGIRVVQAFANESYETALFSQNNRRFRQAKLRAYWIMAWSSSSSYILMRLVTLFVLLAGAWFIVQGDLSTGEFVSFILLTNILFRPIEKINAVIDTYPKGIAGFRRFTEIMDTEPDIADDPAAVAVDQLSGDIAYHRVTFSYDDRQPVLQEINLTIQRGETIAFVGPSGAGKTTLCSLLPRFYEISGGSITIDGYDIRRVTLASLRRQIGIVQQDVFLFFGTIRENIAYGDLQASEAQIWEAAAPGWIHSIVASRARHTDRRTRSQALGRAEAAAGDCADVPEESADPDSRRSHIGTRHRDRASDSAIAG
jgi:ATP-binding cassette subfamily B protein